MEPAKSTTGTDVPIAAVVLGLVALAGLVWFVNSPAPVRVIDASAEDDSLVVSVNTCGGDLTVDVYEDDGVVRVRVLDHRFRLRLAGDDCLDGLTIPLSVPLGERILVDDTTSQQILLPASAA